MCDRSDPSSSHSEGEIPMSENFDCGISTSRSLLVSAIASGVLFAAGGAQAAFWSRQDASYCLPLSGSELYFDGSCSSAAANTVVLACPVNDTSTQPKSSITTFNVHVDDKSQGGSVWAFRCVDYWNAVGGSCGGIDTSVNGIDTLHPPSFAGWNAPNFGYMVIYLPPKSGNNKSCIKGYYTAG
jgi:hypothetical protein